MESEGQNRISKNFLQGSDLADREHRVLADAARLTDFVPKKLLGRSSWWGSSKIGAFHYEGLYHGKKAVLKVQGVRPAISEIFMLEAFARENRSKVIRPPHLYAFIPWSDQKRYEALVMEKIEDKKVVSIPTDEEEVKRFFELYQDYRQNCLRNPWVVKPNTSISEEIENNFEVWQEASKRIFPHHPYRKAEDDQLIIAAIKVLQRGYQGADWEFQHGHFSADDLYLVDDEVLLLSNLYWSWRVPLSDAVFAQHWHIYRLANEIGDIIPTKLEEQRHLWLSGIFDLPQTQGRNVKLLELALLERATAGLVIDALTVDPKKPIAEYAVESTRQRVKELLQRLW